MALGRLHDMQTSPSCIVYLDQWEMTPYVVQALHQNQPQLEHLRMGLKYYVLTTQLIATCLQLPSNCRNMYVNAIKLTSDEHANTPWPWEELTISSVDMTQLLYMPKPSSASGGCVTVRFHVLDLKSVTEVSDTHTRTRANMHCTQTGALAPHAPALPLGVVCTLYGNLYHTRVHGRSSHACVCYLILFVACQTFLWRPLVHVCVCVYVCVSQVRHTTVCAAQHVHAWCVCLTSYGQTRYGLGAYIFVCPLQEHTGPLQEWLQHVTWEREDAYGNIEINLQDDGDKLSTHTNAQLSLLSTLQMSTKCKSYPPWRLREVATNGSFKSVSRNTISLTVNGSMTRLAVEALRARPAWVTEVCMGACEYPLSADVYKQLTRDMPLVAKGLAGKVAKAAA